MNAWETPRELYIGRWQPFHNGHMAIIKQALSQGKPVAIGIRSMPLSESDPWLPGEVKDMLETVFANDDVAVFIMPNICAVNIGRKVGYEITRHDMPENITCISATGIRTARDTGDDSWRSKVPLAVERWLDRQDES